MNNLQLNVNQLFEEQLYSWPLLRDNYESLNELRTRTIAFDGFDVILQFNPGRVRSVTANIQNAISSKTGCFLCPENRPEAQKMLAFGTDFVILCNPFPVFSRHLTIASRRHTPQTIKGNLREMLVLAKEIDDYIVFFNGARCGASAPSHLHFQAGLKSEFPLFRDILSLKNKYGRLISDFIYEIKDGLRTCFLLEGDDISELITSFEKQFVSQQGEPDLNVLLWYDSVSWKVCVFERKQHRPRQYFREGEDQILISPATVEMSGLIVTPRLSDFEKLTRADLIDIFGQVN